jgi:hypothetical protein
VIRSIRTTYNGITFRSKLESRWAYFLTQLAIPFVYEPELIDLGVLRYLPDFRIGPFPGYWLEIKGDIGDDGLTIVRKCELLAAHTGTPVILAFYDPLAAKCAAFLPNGAMYQAHFGMCKTCGGLAVKFNRRTLCAHANAPLTERAGRRSIFDAAVAARDI